VRQCDGVGVGRCNSGRLLAWPGTTLGWWAVVCGAFEIAWVIFGRQLQGAIREDVCPGRFCTGGREYVAGALLLGLPACVLGVVALTRRGERSLLVWLAVVPAVTFTVFWVLFAAGELLFPH
jgi:hypothetical protein